jgi:hypothetical protein
MINMPRFPNGKKSPHQAFAIPFVFLPFFLLSDCGFFFSSLCDRILPLVSRLPVVCRRRRVWIVM